MLAFLVGCLVHPVERNCEHRQAYYPDPDGDGLGDRSQVFVGCAQPAGWVTVPEPEPPPDTGSADTGP